LCGFFCKILRAQECFRAKDAPNADGEHVSDKFAVVEKSHEFTFGPRASVLIESDLKLWILVWRVFYRR